MSLFRSRPLRACLIAFALLAAACGGDDDDTDAASGIPDTTAEEAEEATSTTETTAAEEEAAASGEVEVTAVDYEYEGIPETLAVGSTLTLTNESDVELHELVAFKLPDDEQRPVDELMQLPEEELGALFGGPPGMVLVAPPGGAPQIAAVGDGTLTEPGRYLLFCGIPVGADPAEYMAAAQASGGGPPEVEGGPPHFTRGMYAEATVE